MKICSFYFLIIAFGVCCLGTKFPGRSANSLVLKAINDIVQPWYEGKTSPCENGAYKIDIGDTLKWRDFKYTSNQDISIILKNLGVDKNIYTIASALKGKTSNIDFLLERIRFLNSLPREPLCTQYYFSNLYFTKNENEFVIQYISNSFELIEESVLLLQFDGKKFTIKDYLSTKSLWF